MTVKSDVHLGEAAALVISGVGEGLEAAAHAEKEHVEANFDQERDATGAPWQELADSTIRQKGHDQILYEKGDLRNAFYVQRLGAFGVAFGNSDPKAQIHEDGTETIPPRPMLGPARVHLEHEELHEHITQAIRTRLAMLKFRSMF